MKDYDNEQPTETASIPTYLSLCSGYDGIGLGLKRVIPDLRTIAHVEIEAFAICNLVEKMEAGELDACPVFTDLKRFPFEDLRERQPTILSAGFPCQPFSSAGKRQATDDPRHLYPFIADGITACKPEYVFLENVDGIVSSKTADGESVLLYVLRDLETRGYTCSWGTFSAAEIGAPHLRKRVFILAKLGDADGGDKGSHGIEHRILSATSRKGEADRLERTGDVTELADGESIERQRALTSGDRCERPEETVGSTCTLYPSRPGERQHEWEEPRVVSSEASSKLGNAEHDGSPRTSTGRRSGQASDGSAQGTNETGEPSGASGREDVSNLQGGERGQLGDASSIGSHRGSEDSTDVEPEVLGTRHESYVADAECIDGRRERREEQAGQPSGEPIKDSDQSDGRSEAQSELGGTVDARKRRRGVDAITNRVDRLRLLGNGVVPDCAELAFRTLFNQLHNNER